MSTSKFHAVLLGAGGGTGRSVALRFAKSYPVVLLARRPESYNDIVKEIEQAGGRALGITADAADPASIASAFAAIKQQLPESKLAAAIFNVSAGFAVKPFLELKTKDLDDSLNSSARGFFAFAQQSLPLLVDAVADSPHPPTLLITGATASLKGSAKFGSFAAGKFALRALGQSLAREFGPQGVHVAHAIIDGIIAGPRTAQWPGGADDGHIKPDSIAESYWHLHTQHRSGFTQEIDLRPWSEKF